LYGNPYYGIEIDIWAAGCVLAELFTTGYHHAAMTHVGKESGKNGEENLNK